jgi:hypothetical protein
MPKCGLYDSLTRSLLRGTITTQGSAGLQPLSENKCRPVDFHQPAADMRARLGQARQYRIRAVALVISQKVDVLHIDIATLPQRRLIYL